MKKKIFSGLKPLYFPLLYASDVVMFILSVFIASAILKFQLIPPYPRFFLFTLLILLVNHSAYKLYRDKRNLFDDNDFMSILYSSSITFFIMMMFILTFDQSDWRLLLVLLLSIIFTVILTSLARMVLDRIVFLFRKNGYDRKKVLFFGEKNDELAKKIENNKSFGYEIMKITSDLNVLKRHLGFVDIVFLHMEKIDDKLLELIIKNDSIHWKIVPPVLNLVIEPVAFDEFKDYPIINISDMKKNSGYLVLKRIIDLAVSGIALLILSPLFLLVAAVIKITMPGTVFFRHERLGKNLKPFRIFKFRTMIVGADAMKAKLIKKNEVKGLFKMKDDPRITKFGKFLRRSCIDELPQLINIFKGDMTLVGPRPHLRSELENFRGWRMVRFNVKPGLTGLWQVNGRHELNFDKAVLYDIYYIKHMSLLLDISIILKTIPALLINKGRY